MHLPVLLPALTGALAFSLYLRSHPLAQRLAAASLLAVVGALVLSRAPDWTLRWVFVLAYALLVRRLYPFPRRPDTPPAHAMDAPRFFWLMGAVALLTFMVDLVYG